MFSLPAMTHIYRPFEALLQQYLDKYRVTYISNSTARMHTVAPVAMMTEDKSRDDMEDATAVSFSRL